MQLFFFYCRFCLGFVFDKRLSQKGANCFVLILIDDGQSLIEILWKNDKRSRSIRMNGFTDLQTSEKHLRFSITQRLHLLQNFLYGYDTKKVIRTRKIYDTIDKKLIYVFEIYKY